MQDNELDNLFRSKLGGLEIEPAAQVWENIQSQLGGQKKRAWAPVWSIAATVLVLLTAGTWFLLNEPVKNNPKQIVQIKPLHTVTEPVTLPDTEQPDAKKEILQPTVKTAVSANRIAAIKQSKVAGVTAVNKQHAKPASEGEISINVQTPVLATVQNKPVMQAVVPEMNLNVPLNNDEPIITKQVNTLAADDSNNEPEKKVKKRGFRSLGGLINAVIAKVDKREDKLIEFTETDEDQSNLTGINIGLVKFKKEK